MKKIIGILGWIGSGKGTVGNYLVDQRGFTALSFAGNLKDATAAIFGWPRDMLEGDTVASRAWREQPDDFWSRKMQRQVTPRWVLQHLGTDVLRRQFFDDIWMAGLERKISQCAGSVVITDVRFPNEVQMLADMGANFIWVRRNPEPLWAQDAIADPLSMKIRSDVHASEYEWLGVRDYHVIWNSGTLPDLYKKINQCL
jgi:hypothetical protein